MLVAYREMDQMRIEALEKKLEKLLSSAPLMSLNGVLVALVLLLNLLKI